MRITTIVFVLFFSLNAFTQNTYKYGAKAGLNFTGYHKGTSVFTDEFGLNLGGFIETNIYKSFNLQAELVFNQKKGRIGLDEFQNNSIDSEVGYIDLPILLELKLSRIITFQAGPQLGFKIYNNSKVDGEETNIDVNSIDAAVVGGFEIDLSEKFFTQFRYSYGLSEVIADEPYKNSVISISLGYYLN